MFNEYLPSLLGNNAVSAYTGYDPSVNPSIANVFSEAAFRFGHSQLDDDVQFLNNNGTNFAFSYTGADGTTVAINTAADIADGDTGMGLLDAFFNPNVMSAPGAEGALLKYLSSDVAQNVDLKMVDSVRNICSARRAAAPAVRTCSRSTSSAAATSDCRRSTRHALLTA